MPLFRRYRRKPFRKPWRKNWKKRYHNRKRYSIIPRGIKRGTFPVRREMTYFVSTNQSESIPDNWHLSDAPTGDLSENYIMGTQVFAMSELPNFEEFTGLWKEYKLNCVLVTITPLWNSNYQSAHDNGIDYRPPYGAQLMCQWKNNKEGVGIDSAFLNSDWNQYQAKKRKVISNGRSIKFKVFPKLLNRIQTGATSSISLGHSSYLPTTQPEVSHYGLDFAFSWVDPRMRFGRPDDGAMPIRFRVDYRYYMTLRGIH